MRHMLRPCVSTDDLQAVVDMVVAEAKLGDIKAAALILKHCYAPPAKRCDEISIDEEQLDTIEGCMAAHRDIFRELAAGRLDHDSATALRAVVDSTMRAHQFKAGQDQGLMLAEAGTEAIILDASDPDVEGQLRRAITSMTDAPEPHDG